MFMKMTAVCYIAPCSLIEVDRCFRDAYSVIALMIEAVRISETSVYFNETTRRYSCYRHTRRRENLKYQKLGFGFIYLSRKLNTLSFIIRLERVRIKYNIRIFSPSLLILLYNRSSRYFRWTMLCSLTLGERGEGGGDSER
jgi:hypothetical protein